MKSLTEQLVNSVNNVVLETSPYDNFYMSTVFEQVTYDRLLFSLPSRSDYEQFLHPDAKVSEYESTRLRFPLLDSNLNKTKDKEFWQELTKACVSKELHQAIFKKLEGDIKARFKMPIMDIPCHPEAFLFKDITGYKISPHSDSPKKVVTFQLYLPEDESNVDVGTIVYTQDKQQKSQFHKVKQYRFAPNTGYGFAVSRKSWHGVEPLGKPGLERNTLMIIYYLDKPEEHRKYGY